MSKLRYRGRLGESQPSKLTAAAPISYLENSVRFSFRDCDKDDYCVRKLSDNEIDRFYQRLGHFEGITWKQVWGMPHDKGFSAEKKESGNFSFLSERFAWFESFLHFRVNGTAQPFRVFGAQKDDLCYVLLVDREGEINH